MPDRKSNGIGITNYRGTYDRDGAINITGFYRLDSFGVIEGVLPDIAG